MNSGFVDKTYSKNDQHTVERVRHWLFVIALFVATILSRIAHDDAFLKEHSEIFRIACENKVFARVAKNFSINAKEIVKRIHELLRIDSSIEVMPENVEVE